MRKNKYKIKQIGVFTFALLICLCTPLVVFAEGTSLDLELGETTQLISDGQSGSSTSHVGGDGTAVGTITDSSSYTAGTISDSELNLINAKYNLYSLLESWRNGAMPQDMIWKRNMLRGIDMLDLNADNLMQMQDMVDAFKAGAGDALYNIYNQNYLVGFMGTLNDGGFGSLPEDAKEKIMDEIAAAEGKHRYSSGGEPSRYRRNVSVGSNNSITIDPGLFPAVYLEWNPEAFNRNSLGLSGNGIRSDVASFGLRDSGSWISRYEAFLRYHRQNRNSNDPSVSNAFEDIVHIGRYQEYAVSSVNKDYVISENYDSNRRLWKVRNQWGEEVASRITDNPRHEFDFDSTEFGPGTYTVTAQQLVKAIRGCYVTYDVYDYLFDLETGIILYSDETRISYGGGRGMYVNIGASLPTEQWVDTDEYYVVTVTDTEAPEGNYGTSRLE